MANIEHEGCQVASYSINPVTVHPESLKAGDQLGFKVIAVIGNAGDWAAYRGLTYWSDNQTASEGDKLDQLVVEALFYAPKAAGLKYRSL